MKEGINFKQVIQVISNKKGNLIIGGIIVAMILVVSIIIGLLIFLNEPDPLEISKTAEIIDNFLSDYPNAEVKIASFSASESKVILDSIRKDCGNNSLEAKNFYRVLITDKEENLSLIAWIDGDSEVIECVKSFDGYMLSGEVDSGNECSFGEEIGEKCDSISKCTSGEWIDGCCIAGTCFFSLELVGEVCTIGSERGIRCSSESDCSSGEFLDGCCIAGVCSSDVGGDDVVNTSKPIDTGNISQSPDLFAPQWSQHAYDAANTGQSPYIGPQTNNLYWKFTEGKDSCNYEIVYTSPVIDYYGNLYFGSSNGSLFSLTPEKEINWQYTIPDSYNRYNCGGDEDTWNGEGGLYDLNIMWEPAMDNETIYFGTSGILNNWAIYAIDITTGQQKWKHSLSGPLNSQLKIYKDRLYFSTLNLETKESHIYSISNNGDDVKSYSLGSEIKGNSPGIFNDVLYVGSEEGLLAFDLPLSNPKWTYSTLPFQWSTPAISDAIYINSRDKNVLFKISFEGKLIWEADIYGSESGPSIANDGTIYIGNMNGDKSPGYDSPIDLGDINMRISAFNIDKSKKWDFFIPQAISCNNEADDCPGKIIYDHSRAVDKTPIIGADGTIYSGNDAKSFIGISPDSSIKWIADKMSGITVDEWDHSPSISKDGTLYVGPAGGGFGGLYAFNDNLESSDDGEKLDDGGGETCEVDSFIGVPCSSDDACSGSFEMGCCFDDGVCSD